MKNLLEETVTDVHHWSDRVFSFRTTRAPGFRFKNGEFTMIGIRVEGKPLMRAYSIASPNYEEALEFLSIKVDNGPLTSRLQHIKQGDTVLINSKPTGTLVLDRLRPGRNLYLIATGTGLAPFMSIIQDPETYEQYDKVILAHGVRRIEDLAYRAFISKDLPEHEFLGEMVREQLIYYPVVTREPFPTQGHLNDLLESGQLYKDLQLPEATVEQDRFMVCGSIPLNKEMIELLGQAGFSESKRGEQAEFVVERAFVG